VTKIRPDAEKVKLVCDNLNVHSIGTFYEAFERSLARSLVKRLEIIPTPKHGSWLNIAENELSALTRQCVHGRRFGTIEKLRNEVATWAAHCNVKQKERPMAIHHRRRSNKTRFTLSHVVLALTRQ